MKSWSIGKIGWVGIGAAGLSVWTVARRRQRLDLRGRVAVVTGGGRGLGLAITRELSRHGCRVAICGRDGDVIRRAALELERQGFEILGKACDTSDPEQVRAFVQAVLANYGSVDILINNAGQCFVGPAAELQAPDMQRALRNIFWAQYYPTMELLPHLRSRGFGRIVNITSIGGKLPLPHQAAYVAAKYAATGWSQALAVELSQDGIAVSTLTPPPLSDGAPPNLHFNGNREAELQWFTRALTSPLSAASPERTARAVIDALRRGQREGAVTAACWLATRAHGFAPNLVSRALSWVNRRLPAAAGPGRSSSMRLGATVAAASTQPDVQALVRRARVDEARYLPEGGSSVLGAPDPPAAHQRAGHRHAGQ